MGVIESTFQRCRSRELFSIDQAPPTCFVCSHRADRKPCRWPTSKVYNSMIIFVCLLTIVEYPFRLSDDGIAIALYMKSEPDVSHDGDVAEDSPYRYIFATKVYRRYAQYEYFLFIRLSNRLASPHFRFPPLVSLFIFDSDVSHLLTAPTVSNHFCHRRERY